MPSRRDLSVQAEPRPFFKRRLITVKTAMRKKLLMKMRNLIVRMTVLMTTSPAIPRRETEREKFLTLEREEEDQERIKLLKVQNENF